MIQLGPILGAIAASFILGGGGRRGGHIHLFGRKRRRTGLIDLLASCYGKENEMIKMWPSAKASNSDWKGSVHGAVTKGQWFDLKPEETAATTSKLGPGIIEIDMKAGKQAPPPPIPKIPEAQDQEDNETNPLDFLEVPGENIEESFGVKCLRVIIAAAHADGVLQQRERDLIEERLKGLPQEDAGFARRELENPAPMDDIIKGVNREEDKKFLFGLAVISLRSDGKISPEENQFARDLAKKLNLTKETAMQIIKSARPEA